MYAFFATISSMTDGFGLSSQKKTAHTLLSLIQSHKNQPGVKKKCYKCPLWLAEKFYICLKAQEGQKYVFLRVFFSTLVAPI